MKFSRENWWANIGPNGAGKIHHGQDSFRQYCSRTAAECAVVLGLVPVAAAHESTRGTSAVVFGQRSQLWWDLPVDGFLSASAGYLQGASGGIPANDEGIDRGIGPGQPAGPARAADCSLGQRMRCELAASLLHRPSVLFLDEPTIGLDAGTRLAVREFIRRINREQGSDR